MLVEGGISRDLTLLARRLRRTPGLTVETPSLVAGEGLRRRSARVWLRLAHISIPIIVRLIRGGNAATKCRKY